MKKIAIISTLKPTTEVRMYERFTKSLAQTNKYEINIIGIASKKIHENQNLIFHHPLPPIENTWISRIKNWSIIYQKLKTIKPDLVIYTTPELIPLVYIYRQLNDSKIIYDVQEDYYKNIIYQRLYPRASRWFLANFIRLLEKLSRAFTDHYLLAEKCFETDLKFLKKTTTIQNKTAILPHVPAKQSTKLRLLFSGTLSDYSGIKVALNRYRNIKTHYPDAELHIIGYAIQADIQKWLFSIAENDPAIRLTGITGFVPHANVIQAIADADVGLICHDELPSNAGRIPTKLFEYTSMQLPYLVSRSATWLAYGQKAGGALAVDFNHASTEKLKENISQARETYGNSKWKESLWSEEEPKLIDVINTLLSDSQTTDK